MSKKIKEKRNPPYYMNHEGCVEKKPKEPEKIQKFRLGIDKNNSPIITIDNITHFMTPAQFHAFTCGCININKKTNPEVEYKF